MRSLLQIALALVLSTNLVACVTDDDTSIEDQLADENDIGYQDESLSPMMENQLAADNVVELQDDAAAVKQLGNETGASLHDGTSAAANRDGAVVPTAGVDTAATQATTRPNDHVTPGSIDATPNFRVPGRRDGSNRR